MFLHFYSTGIPGHPGPQGPPGLPGRDGRDCSNELSLARVSALLFVMSDQYCSPRVLATFTKIPGSVYQAQRSVCLPRFLVTVAKLQLPLPRYFF